MSPVDSEQQPGHSDKDLPRLLAGLRRLGRRRTIELLNPGIPRYVTERILGELQLTAPEDLVELYEWRAGSDAEAAAKLDDLYLLPGYYILSVKHAVIEYRARADDEHWNPSWLPVLADGGGSFLTVICDAERPDFGQVVGQYVDGIGSAVAFWSVRHMAKTIAQAYDDRIIFVDEQGYLEWDDEAFAELADRMNAGTEFWRR